MSPSFALPAGPSPTDKVAMQFAQQMAQGKFALATKSFDALMTKAMPEQQLSDLWQALVTNHGPFKAFGTMRNEPFGPFKIFFVPATFGAQTIDFKVVVNSAGKIGGFFIVPHTDKVAAVAVKPSDPFEEVATKVVCGPYSLDGLWTLPKTAAPYPALILVHGSGPGDRDQTIGFSKPFKDLAQGLAAQGIAVLRYDKRTKQYGTTLDVNALTVQEESIDDALAAVKLAQSNTKIDASRVFVLGLSLGGMLLPRIAEQAPAIKGGIVMAGSTRPLEDLLVEQTEYILNLSPHTSEGDKLLAEVKEKVKTVKSKDLSPDTPLDQLPLNVPGKYWLDLRGYDPVAVMQKTSQPMLILQGGRDYQVTVDGDYSRWLTLGQSNHSSDHVSRFTFKLYPNLNHIFATGQGMATPAEYMTKPAHVDKMVIDDIASWIKSLN